MASLFNVRGFFFFLAKSDGGDGGRGGLRNIFYLNSVASLKLDTVFLLFFDFLCFFLVFLSMAFYDSFSFFPFPLYNKMARKRFDMYCKSPLLFFTSSC